MALITSAAATFFSKVRWALEGDIYKVRLNHRCHLEVPLSEASAGRTEQWSGYQLQLPQEDARTAQKKREI